MKEKEYSIIVEIKFENILTASSKKEAVALVKDIFAQEHNIDLTNTEIKSVIINERKKENK